MSLSQPLPPPPPQTRTSPPPDLLLGGYVDAHGRALSSVVRRSVASTSWRAAQEPRGPRPVCDLLLERLGRAEAEVGRLVEASGRGGGEGGGGIGSGWHAIGWTMHLEVRLVHQWGL